MRLGFLTDNSLYNIIQNNGIFFECLIPLIHQPVVILMVIQEREAKVYPVHCPFSNRVIFAHMYSMISNLSMSREGNCDFLHDPT